ncbi:MAG TPA: aldo/keto reductase, partial [Usitatibacter sp.]|nr:aldo/keto reductase [Usitatibacter sp.]
MDRRELLRFLAAAGMCGAQGAPRAAPPEVLAKPIPSSGERLPVVGLGTWLTFDVGDDAVARHARGEILKAFFAAGGRLVDSSPMYGTSEEVVGAEAARLERQALFAATKVWTIGALAGRRQIEHSRELWRLPRLDLLQVHNLLDWETQLATLQAMKAAGQVRYIGVTTSHGRRHDVVARILRRERLDFVQLSYSLADRAGEALLDLAAERGVALIANRPFDGGALFYRVRGRELPAIAAEADCQSWAEVFLKFIVSH